MKEKFVFYYLPYGLECDRGFLSLVCMRYQDVKKVFLSLVCR